MSDEKETPEQEIARKVADKLTGKKSGKQIAFVKFGYQGGLAFKSPNEAAQFLRLMQRGIPVKSDGYGKDKVLIVNHEAVGEFEVSLHAETKLLYKAPNEQ